MRTRWLGLLGPLELAALAIWIGAAATASVLIDGVFSNLVADLIGLFLTLLVIEQWAKRREAARVRPIHEIAKKDAFSIYRECISISEYALISTVTIDEVGILQTSGLSLADHRIGEMIDRLDLGARAKLVDGTPGMIRYVLWADEIRRNAVNITFLSGRFIERYALFSPPELLEAIHALTECPAIHFPNSYPQTLVGGGRMPGILRTLPEAAERLRAAIAILHKNLSGESIYNPLPSNELFNRVIQEVQAAPWRDEQHPWRPTPH